MWEIGPVNDSHDALPDDLKAKVEIYYGRKEADSFEQNPFCANFEFKDFKVKNILAEFGCSFTICQIIFENFSHFLPLFHFTIYVLAFLEI